MKISHKADNSLAAFVFEDRGDIDIPGEFASVITIGGETTISRFRPSSSDHLAKLRWEHDRAHVAERGYDLDRLFQDDGNKWTGKE